MNTLPPEQAPDDVELETRLRAHFDEHFELEYGEPLPAATVLERIAPRLHSPTTRIQAAIEGATEALRERVHSILRRTPEQAAEEEEVTPGSSSAAAITVRSRRIFAALAPVTAVLVIVGLAAALFLPRLMQPAFPTPANWHDITPPTPEAISNYAASPDVPGLMLACIGGRAGSLSASPMGPAHIWRTRDGGATWEQIPQPVVTAGCQIAPSRGEAGTFYLSDTYATTPALWVTHDQGGTWTQIPVSDETVTGLPASASVAMVFQLLAQGVYRDGALYSAGTPDHAGTRPHGISSFALTRDDGRTWTPLEATADPNSSQGYTVSSIAADYSTSGAWFRLLTSDSTPQSPSVAVPDVLLEHSADNGRTWRVVSRIKVLGPVPAFTMQLLATTPTQPGRVCVALDMLDLASSAASAQANASTARITGAIARQGPPYQPSAAVGMYGSDDAGATWHGGTVAQYSGVYGYPALPGVPFDGGPVMRGVQIDALGNCFLATTHVQFTPSDTTTIWQLAPKSSSAQSVQLLQGILLGYFAHALGPDGTSRRFVAMAAKAGPLVEVSCQDPDPCVAPAPVAPHLIWTEAP